MECIDIDFDVLDSNNPKKLMIGDTSSNWLTAENLPAYIEITIAGSRQPKIMTFSKKSLMTFHSINLGISSLSKDCSKQKYTDLPDGVYTIKLQSGYEDIYVKKYYLKTDILEQTLSKKIVENALNKTTNNKTFIDTVLEIDYKLLVAKSFIREGNILEATRFYNEAVDVFKLINK